MHASWRIRSRRIDARVWVGPDQPARSLPFPLCRPPTHAMKQLTPKQKHDILVHYRPRSPNHSFVALAKHAEGGVTDRSIRNWYQRWDGTPTSLQHRTIAGRPRTLSRAQVKRHVQPRIRSANRKHHAIHYPDILPAVRSATHKQLTLRTLQRYGKEELGVKQKTVKIRTARERKCTHRWMEAGHTLP